MKFRYYVGDDGELELDAKDPLEAHQQFTKLFNLFETLQITFADSKNSPFIPNFPSRMYTLGYPCPNAECYSNSDPEFGPKPKSVWSYFDLCPCKGFCGECETVVFECTKEQMIRYCKECNRRLECLTQIGGAR